MTDNFTKLKHHFNEEVQNLAYLGVNRDYEGEAGVILKLLAGNSLYKAEKILEMAAYKLEVVSKMQTKLSEATIHDALR